MQLQAQPKLRRPSPASSWDSATAPAASRRIGPRFVPTSTLVVRRGLLLRTNGKFDEGLPDDSILGRRRRAGTFRRMDWLNRGKECPKSTRAFYFIKNCSFEDPEQKERLMEADNEFQRKIQARNKIIEVERAKKEERSIIISELKPLIAENYQYHGVVETLEKHLGHMFRDGNNIMLAHGSVLYSAIEELGQRIKMLNYRVIHESITLLEEKLLVKEIKDIEKARSKVIYLSTSRAKLQDIVDGNESTRDKDKVIDGIRKAQQTTQSRIKVLEDELNIVDTEIESIQEDLDAAIARKDKAYKSLAELRRARDAKNALFFQNRLVLNKGRDYASKGMVAELQGLHKTEVEEFMAQWCQSKAFRQDYEMRNLPSLNARQLDRDGRVRT